MYRGKKKKKKLYYYFGKHTLRKMIKASVTTDRSKNN